MKSVDILDALSADMPLSFAMDWDNVGLLLGRRKKEVRKVMIGLDPSTSVVEEATKKGADLLLTHHPLIFSPLKRIVDEDIVGARIIHILQKDMAYIAMHTNYDVAEHCMADIAAGRIGLNGVPMEVTESVEKDGAVKDLGIGKVGELDRDYSLEELAKKVKEAFGLQYVRIYGVDKAGERIRKAAISPGSGKGMYSLAKKAGAQVLISGDITHHEGLDAAESGITIIDAGHYGLEHIFMEDMKKRLEKIDSSLEIFVEEVKFPEIIL